MTEITRNPLIITVRSRDLDNLNAYGSSGNMNLFQQIQSNLDEILTIQVIAGIFPNSWNNLSSTLKNNKFRFSESDDTEIKVLSIPDGNYSIDELMSEVKKVLDSNSSNNCVYTLTYSDITNSVSITHNKTSTIQTTLDFLSDDTIRRFLGFTQGEFSITSSEPLLKSDRAVDITDANNSLFVRSDLNNQKVIESSSTKPSNIIACIPIPMSRNNFFVFDPMNPIEVQLGQNSISSFNLAITWQDSSSVDMRKGDWELVLKINYRRLPKAERINFNRITNLEQRLAKFEQVQQGENLTDEQKMNIRNSIKNNKNVDD